MPSVSATSEPAAGLTLGRERMRRGVQLVLLVREPQPPVRVEHLLAQARQELLEHPSPVDPRPAESSRALASLSLFLTSTHTRNFQLSR